MCVNVQLSTEGLDCVARSVVSPLGCCVVRYAGVDAQRRVWRVDRGSPLHRYWDEAAAVTLVRRGGCEVSLCQYVTGVAQRD